MYIFIFGAESAAPLILFAARGSSLQGSDLNCRFGCFPSSVCTALFEWCSALKDGRYAEGILCRYLLKEAYLCKKEGYECEGKTAAQEAGIFL